MDLNNMKVFKIKSKDVLKKINYAMPDLCKYPKCGKRKEDGSEFCCLIHWHVYNDKTKCQNVICDNKREEGRKFCLNHKVEINC